MLAYYTIRRVLRERRDMDPPVRFCAVGNSDHNNLRVAQTSRASRSWATDLMTVNQGSVWESWLLHEHRSERIQAEGGG